MNKNTTLLLLFLFVTPVINAQVIFQKTFKRSDNYNDAGATIRQTNDGGYIITGLGVDTATGNYDAYLFKTDFYGDTIWTKYFGGVSSFDAGKEVCQTTDGGYIMY